MEWYHWINAYMIIIGMFLMGVIGDQMGGWGVFICALAILLGILGIKFLPHKEKL